MGVSEPRADAITGDCRKLLTDELHGLYSSPNTIRVIKSRRMGWAERIARVGERRTACRFLVGTPERKKPPEGLHCYTRTILKWILEIRLEEWTGFIWLSTEKVAGCFEHSNEPSSSIKCWEILE
jgi:hypothetical protein